MSITKEEIMHIASMAWLFDFAHVRHWIFLSNIEQN